MKKETIDMGYKKEKVDFSKLFNVKEALKRIKEIGNSLKSPLKVIAGIAGSIALFILSPIASQILAMLLVMEIIMRAIKFDMLHPILHIGTIVLIEWIASIIFVIAPILAIPVVVALIADFIDYIENAIMMSKVPEA